MQLFTRTPPWLKDQPQLKTLGRRLEWRILSYSLGRLFVVLFVPLAFSMSCGCQIFQVSLFHYVCKKFQLFLPDSSYVTFLFPFDLKRSLCSHIYSTASPASFCRTTSMLTKFFFLSVSKLSNIRSHIGRLLFHSSSARFSLCCIAHSCWGGLHYRRQIWVCVA